MDITQAIRSYASQPITHQLLMSLLKDYKRPNDKVNSLVKKGVLESIKKGIYIAGPILNTIKPEPFLIANHLLGPSYISLDSALSFHGFIPERVYEFLSVTTKASRKFNTPMGTFSYTQLPLPYYSFGIEQVRLSDDQYVMIATPEKAIFDKVITTSGLILRSEKGVKDYFLDNLRMEEKNLRALNVSDMEQWIPNAVKKSSLLNVIKMINRL
jgi:hypothetical protein